MEITAVNTGQLLLLLLIGVLAFVGRKLLKEFDDHVRLCTRRAEYNARMVQWMGDGMFQVAKGLKIELPPRPKPNEHVENNT